MTAPISIAWVGTFRDSWKSILATRELGHMTPQACLQKAQTAGAKYVGFSGNFGTDTTTECSYGPVMDLNNDTQLPHIKLADAEPNVRFVEALGLYLGREGNWVNTFYEVPATAVTPTSTFVITKPVMPVPTPPPEASTPTPLPQTPGSVASLPTTTTTTSTITAPPPNKPVVQLQPLAKTIADQQVAQDQAAALSTSPHKNTTGIALGIVFGILGLLLLLFLVYAYYKGWLQQWF